jgi:carbamoyl-phosphate synthase large subunit
MITVLVTGVGALIAQGILHSLNKNKDKKGLRVIGMDLNALTHAKYLCADFIQKPECDESSEQYLDFWTKTIEAHNVDVILPGIEDDVIFLSEPRCQAHRFPSLLNSPDTLSIGLDKYRLSTFADQQALLSIPTCMASDAGSVATLIEKSNKTIVKPRRSNGSRGIHRFSSSAQLIEFLQSTSIEELDKYIVQPMVGDDSEEYTASIFGFGDGSYQGPIVFKRLLANTGYTKYAQTVSPPNDILSTIHKLATTCSPIGPTNLQFRASKERYYLMEVNPRFSSTTSLKAAFGFDETEMALEFFLAGKKEFQLELRHGEAWRYTSDFIRFS